MKSVPALHLHLKRSRCECLLVGLLHLAALPMPWLSAIPGGLAVLLTLLVVLSALHLGYRQLQPRPVSLRLLADGRWLLGWPAAEAEATLADGVYLTPWLLVVPLVGQDGRPLRLLLWPDSASHDELRRLRSWLRWGRLLPQPDLP